MAALSIVSNRPGAGKTCLAGALARRHALAGRRVAYYKPFSAKPDTDPDVAFMQSALARWGSAQGPVPVPAPLSADTQQPDSPMPQPSTAEAQQAIAALEGEFDLVLVEWDTPTAITGQPTLLLYGLDVSQGIPAATVSAATLGQQTGADLEGVIINNTPRYRRAEVERELVSGLRAQGIPAVGAVPEDREMLALTLGQVADFLAGSWVEEPSDADLWIDRFLIGGNIMDSGPNYFGRYANQAVITRTARPDIQMASLMCDTRFLVLTGGGEPTEYIRVEAQKHDASLLLVEGSTLETAESLGGLLGLSNPYSEHKVCRFTELVEQHIEGGLDGLLP